MVPRLLSMLNGLSSLSPPNSNAKGVPIDVKTIWKGFQCNSGVKAGRKGIYVKNCQFDG